MKELLIAISLLEVELKKVKRLARNSFSTSLPSLIFNNGSYSL